MVIPSIFPPSREALINYDWVDVASATGYVIYDGYITVDSVGQNFSLVNSSVATHLYSIAFYFADDDYFITEGTESAPAAATKILDQDFDLEAYKLPRIIKGIAHIKMKYLANSDGSDDFEYYLILKIRKWNGVSETDLVSVQSATLTTTGVGAKEVNLSLDCVVPQTHFKKGEILRLTIEGYIKNKNAGADEANIAIGGDPQNRACDTSGKGLSHAWIFTAGDSRIVLSIPYKIEI